MLIIPYSIVRWQSNVWRSLIYCNACQRTKLVRYQSNDKRISNQITHDSGHTIKAQEVKPGTNFPIGKNLFLGKFDKECLVYPDISSNEELDELNAVVKPLEHLMNKIDSTSVDKDAKIPDDVFKQLRDHGLFGQIIPVQYGGLGLTSTKHARVTEVTGMDGSIALTLAAHQALGIKAILTDGTANQKSQYLPKLASGESIAAFCLYESSSGSDLAAIETKATLSEDGSTYILNGIKTWITNGGIADIFTVFAKTSLETDYGDKIETVTSFLVERAFGGVSSGCAEDTLGTRGSNVCEVVFDNTPVPAENVLGKPNEGFKVALNILNSSRYTFCSSALGAMKKLMGLATEHAISRLQFGKKLKDFGLIQEKLCKTAVNIYAMESMIYFITGIMDNYLEPDTAVESAMVKVFTSEACLECVNDCLQVLGGQAYLKSYPYERYLRDSRILLMFEGTNEILRMFIAMTCLQHTAIDIHDTLKKMTNPLNNFGFMLKKSVERLTTRSEPRLTMRLYDEVHPNLGTCAENLEKRIHIFKGLVEHHLSLYQDSIVEEQLIMKRMTDIAIDLFGIIVCTARASRSVCIGLRNADHEIMLAQQFCTWACMRIDSNIEQLVNGKFINGDEHCRHIAESIFKHTGYCAEHPLTRNW